MRRLSVLISLAAVLLLGLVAIPRLGPATAQEAADDPALAGSWRVIITRSDGVTLFSLQSFGAEGTALVTGLTAVPTPPGAPAGVLFYSPAVGVWEATGPNTANGTFVHLLANDQGQPFGTITIRTTMTLATDGQTFTAESASVLAAPDGTELATFTSTGQGMRMVAEAPSSGATPEA